MVLVVERLVTGLKGRRAQLGHWNQKPSIGKTKPNVIPPNDVHSATLYGGADWKKDVIKSLKAHFPKSKKMRPPDFFAAVIIDGNTLVKDTKLAKQWRQNARHASAVEMELGGVCRAARYGADGRTKVLAIRGLSDIVGYKRSPDWTEYACRSASAFASALIQSGIIRRGE
jgi:nucleoside phosphorylase